MADSTFEHEHGRLLVVDDSHDIRCALLDVLEAEAYRVDLAGDGREALSVLEATPDADLPRVILLDLMMPVMDGYEFRARQRAQPRIAHIPVVIMTAADTQNSARVRGLAADGFFKKPLEVDELLRVVAMYCQVGARS